MTECEHPIEALVGMADGVHCTKCGTVLKAVPVRAEAAAEEKSKKKGGKKDAGK